MVVIIDLFVRHHSQQVAVKLVFYLIQYVRKFSSTLQ